jgi:tRNA A-37 threonylcarbamoyl transferase component Bud32
MTPIPEERGAKIGPSDASPKPHPTGSSPFALASAASSPYIAPVLRDLIAMYKRDPVKAPRRRRRKNNHGDSGTNSGKTSPAQKPPPSSLASLPPPSGRMLVTFPAFRSLHRPVDGAKPAATSSAIAAPAERVIANAMILDLDAELGNYPPIPADSALLIPTINSDSSSASDDDDEAVKRERTLRKKTKPRRVNLPAFVQQAGCLAEAEILTDPSSESSNTTHWPEPYLLVLGRRYQVLRAYQHSSDAAVYRAWDRVTHEHVVLKIATGWNGEVMPKEVRLLNRVQGSPFVCHMVAWHAFMDQCVYVVVLQELPNEPFKAMLCAPVDEVRAYMRGLLMGLQHMHARGVLYRDVKPANFIWSRKAARGGFIDFDCSTFLDEEGLHRATVGTPEYFAPEMRAVSKAKRAGTLQALPYKGYDHRVDLYAAGIVFGHLLFGQTEEMVVGNMRLGSEYISMAIEQHNTNGTNPTTLQACDLLQALLNPAPDARITIEEALLHPWFHPGANTAPIFSKARQPGRGEPKPSSAATSAATSSSQ